MPGSTIFRKYQNAWLILAVLSGISLLIYIILKKMITSNNANIIYGLLKTYGLSDDVAKFATAQSAHETAKLGVPFSSNIFKSNNNAFGMTYAGQKWATGEKNGYANYLTIEDSVGDFVSWYWRHRIKSILPLNITSVEQYVSFFKKEDYFEDTESNYLKGVRYWYKIIFGNEE